MQNKIEARPDFKSDIIDNPFNLLKAIKEHSTRYQENCYNMSVILDAMKTFLNSKQKDGEILQDYTKRFRIAREVLEAHIGGPIILTKIVKAVQGYVELPILDVEAEKNCKYKENVFEQFLAYLAIKEHSTSYQENHYNMSVILDAMKTLLNSKQKDGELSKTIQKDSG